jgi:hypothetical protein
LDVFPYKFLLVGLPPSVVLVGEGGFHALERLYTRNQHLLSPRDVRRLFLEEGLYR